MFKHSRGFLFAAVSSLMLAACGGGSVGEGDDGTDPTDPVVGTLTVLASVPALNSGDSAPGVGTDGVTITALVKDSGNNVMANQPVRFTATAGTLVGGSPALTNSSGQATIKLYTGGDPLLTSVDVTATTGSKTDKITLPVSGNTLSDIAGPNTGAFGVSSTYSTLLKDSAGKAISGRLITFTTTGGTPATSTATTDSNGSVSATLTPTEATMRVVASGASLITPAKTIAVSVNDFGFDAPAANAEINTSSLTAPTVRNVTVHWKRGSANVTSGNVTIRTSRGFVARTTDDPAVTRTKAVTVPITTGTVTVRVYSDEAGPTILTASGMAPVAADNAPDVTRNVEFVAPLNTATAVEIEAQESVIAAGASTTVQATVRDARTNLVKNAPVDFSVSGVSSGTISPSTVVTNSDGIATATYTARNTTSAQQDITLKASVNTGVTTIEDTTLITVGGKATRVILGGGNKLFEENDGATYRLPYTVLVTDAAGNPARNATVTLTLYPIYFRKGAFNDDDAAVITATCKNEDFNRNFNMDPNPTEDANGNGALDIVPTDPWDPGEDLNGDTVLDVYDGTVDALATIPSPVPGDPDVFVVVNPNSEDLNGNGSLTPGNVATVVPTSSTAAGTPNLTLPLDSSGFGVFDIKYAKDFAVWTVVEITAKAIVAGTEGRDVRKFRLPILEADTGNPPNGGLSPFGRSVSCFDAR